MQYKLKVLHQILVLNFRDLFATEDLDSKVEAVRAISMLLQGPFEIGNMVLGFEGVSGIMLALAQSDRAIHQVYSII